MVLASSWKSCVWVFLAWLWDEWCEACWDGQAGCGQQQGDQGRMLEALADGWWLMAEDCGTTQCWQEPESTRPSFWVTHCSGFCSELPTVQDNNFCFWSLQEWWVACETATMGARTKPQRHSRSSLGMYCYMTPEAAPLEGSVHSWTLCRSSFPCPTEPQPFGSAFAGNLCELLRGKSRLKFLLLEKETWGKAIHGCRSYLHDKALWCISDLLTPVLCLSCRLQMTSVWWVSYAGLDQNTQSYFHTITTDMQTEFRFWAERVQDVHFQLPNEQRRAVCSPKP